ncbi:MAG: MarR family transcriptional regulator [Chthoniobacterales bacterium]
MAATTEFDVEKIGQSLAGTARTWRNKLDQRLRPLGLSQSKWTALVHLAAAESTLTQRELAALVGIEEPTLAGILHRLQSDGWIERKESATDRRCKTVHLSRNAKPVIEKIYSTARELRHELISDIPSDDLQTCMAVLSRIRERAEIVSTNGSADGPTTKRNGKIKARMLQPNGE